MNKDDDAARDTIGIPMSFEYRLWGYCATLVSQSSGHVWQTSRPTKRLPVAEAAARDWSKSITSALRAEVVELYERRATEAQPAPIDMVLQCPACGMQHIDAPMTDAQYTERLHESSWWECGGDKPERWTNPPHRSHRCHGCGHIWRPADVATNGVAAVQTAGKADSPIVQPMHSLTAQMQKMCSNWGAYWRAPDAHGVNLTHEQATELLRFALNVEVEVAR